MRLIRKYPNRRLYDTETGHFINLADLRGLIESGLELRVQDKNSGEDITRTLLLQIIAEAEAGGHPILSERLLLDLIRFHGHPLHDFMTRYLERSVDLFLGQVEQMQSRFGEVMDTGPVQAWQTLTQRNLDWWKRMQSRMLQGLDPEQDDEKD